MILPAGCAGPSLQAVGQGGQAAEDGGDVPVGGAWDQEVGGCSSQWLYLLKLVTWILFVILRDLYDSSSF